MSWLKRTAETTTFVPCPNEEDVSSGPSDIESERDLERDSSTSDRTDALYGIDIHDSDAASAPVYAPPSTSNRSTLLTSPTGSALPVSYASPATVPAARPAPPSAVRLSSDLEDESWMSGSELCSPPSLPLQSSMICDPDPVDSSPLHEMEPNSDSELEVCNLLQPLEPVVEPFGSFTMSPLLRQLCERAQLKTQVPVSRRRRAKASNCRPRATCEVPRDTAAEEDRPFSPPRRRIPQPQPAPIRPVYTNSSSPKNSPSNSKSEADSARKSAAFPAEGSAPREGSAGSAPREGSAPSFDPVPRRAERRAVMRCNHRHVDPPPRVSTVKAWH